MTTPRFERFLASLYIDAAARARFVADPRAAAHDAGLTADEIEALARIDMTGLELAARSYAAKRAAAPSQKGGRRAAIGAALRSVLRRD